MCETMCCREWDMCETMCCRAVHMCETMCCREWDCLTWMRQCATSSHGFMWTSGTSMYNSLSLTWESHRLTHRIQTWYVTDMHESRYTTCLYHMPLALNEITCLYHMPFALITYLYHVMRTSGIYESEWHMMQTCYLITRHVITRVCVCVGGATRWERVAYDTDMLSYVWDDVTWLIDTWHMIQTCDVW